jgi:hypothetical protein
MWQARLRKLAGGKSKIVIPNLLALSIFRERRFSRVMDPLFRPWRKHQREALRATRKAELFPTPQILPAAKKKGREKSRPLLVACDSCAARLCFAQRKSPSDRKPCNASLRIARRQPCTRRKFA